MDHYHTEKQVDELLALGDLACLDKRTDPDPALLHGFAMANRQDGVAVAYGRDCGEEGTQAVYQQLSMLDDPDVGISYVYVFTKEQEWKYFRPGYAKEGLRDVAEELAKEYAIYQMERPDDYYGVLNEKIAEQLKQKQTDGQEQGGDISPVLSM